VNLPFTNFFDVRSAHQSPASAYQGLKPVIIITGEKPYPYPAKSTPRITVIMLPRKLSINAGEELNAVVNVKVQFDLFDMANRPPSMPTVSTPVTPLFSMHVFIFYCTNRLTIE
jgi:hypothetical protein